MCRNIKTLFNYEPPATDAEIRASAQQYVRKISGMQKPSKANEALIDEAINDIAEITRHMIDNLITNASPKDREEEAAKARARSASRFA